MDIRDSSDEEEMHNISAFTKFDESIEVRDAEEIQSPINRRPPSSRRPRQNSAVEKPTTRETNSSLNFRR